MTRALLFLLVWVLLLGCDSSSRSNDRRAQVPAAGSTHPADASTASRTSARHPVPAASATASAPAGAPGRGQVLERTFSSAALGVDKRYYVYLPGEYERASRRYPTIYLLHGLGGDERNFIAHAELPAVADRLGLQAIVVMPDGDDGFYANAVAPSDFDACLRSTPPFNPRETPQSYCVRQPRYEDYIVSDLVTHIDATYRTKPDRRARAIGGVSMGGFGALQLAMRHPDVFSSAASHSGLVALLYEGPHPHAPGQGRLATGLAEWGQQFRPAIRGHIRGIFGPDIANWRAHDPALLARKLRNAELALYLDCGTEDGFKLHDHARYLHEVLEAAGVQHRFELVAGNHTFTLWKRRLGASLAFHAAHFEAAGLRHR